MKLNSFWQGLFLIILAIPILSSCRRDYAELEETLTIKTEFLAGTWKVAKVMQYDQEAIDNGFPKEVQSLDITGTAPFGEYTLKLDVDAQGKPSTYTLTPGQAPNYLALTSGNWSVDNPVFTTVLSFFSPNSTLSGRFIVKRIDANRIILRMERRDANGTNPDLSKRTMFLYYEYEFTK